MSKRLLLLLLFFLSYAGNILSQEPLPVEKSDNKIIIEGKVYFLHIVKAGQTLYSISKAYNLREVDIEKENPGVRSGLWPGQVLKIPMVAPPETPETQKVDSAIYINHTFQKGETLFSLSRQYNTTVDEILKANPGIDPSAIKEGQLIFIPKSSQEISAVDYIRHKVKRRETLYSISRQYGLSMDEIKKHNPELHTSTLKTGSILNIPRYKEERETEPVLIEPEKPRTEETEIMPLPDTLTVMEDTTVTDTMTFYDNIPGLGFKDIINVALLLPFNYVDVPDSLKEGSTGITETPAGTKVFSQKNLTQKPSSANYLDFLSGSLLALDSLKKNGISVNLKVFDTQRSPLRMRSIISSGQLDNIDMIFGPFFLNNAEIVSEFSMKKRIPLIIPLLNSETLLGNNPYLFQLNTSTFTELNAVAEYMAQYDDCRIIILHTNSDNEPEWANYLRSRLIKEFNEQIPQRVADIKEVLYDTAVKDDLSVLISSALSADKKNMVIVPSSDEAFVYVAVTQLFFQLKNFNIELFGLPQWSVFQNVDLLYLHALNLRYLTSYYFNYNDPVIKNYLDKSKKEFGLEPVSLTRKGGNYAFLAYDLTWHFIKALNDYGRTFFLYAEQINYNSLMNPFHFKKISPWSGFENTSLKIVRYTPDFNVINENFTFKNKPGFERIPIREGEETENREF